MEFVQNTTFGAAYTALTIVNLKKFTIPLPPLHIQEQIVAEIEAYQKIIGGAKQVVENYKPTIKIDPTWGMVKLGELCDVTSGGTPDRNNDTYWGGTIPYVKTGLINFNFINEADEFITEEGLRNSSARLIAPRTILMAMYGQGVTRGRVAILNIEAAINQAVSAIRINSTNQIDTIFLFYLLSSMYEYLRQISSERGGNQSNLNGQIIKSLQIPLPPFDIQQKIVAQIESEQKAVDACKRLIEIFEGKIKDKIDEVWGE